MQRIATFQKVSKERFVQDFMDSVPGYNAEDAGRLYEEIKLPKRATKGSAGYDFYAPVTFTLHPGQGSVRRWRRDGFFLSIRGVGLDSNTGCS